MYYGSQELARAFRTVRGNTIQIAEEIPEDQYGFQPAPGTRSVAETLAHVAVMPRVQEKVHFEDRLSTLVGFDFFGMMNALMAESRKPRTKAEILDLLRSEGDRYAGLLETSTEEFLGETVRYPEGMNPPAKSRFEMLISPKEHEMHHRAQLMLVERMLGITPHLTRYMQERIAAIAAQK